MIGILKQKYGSYRERRDWVFHYFDWKPDTSSQITLRIRHMEASVFYTDLRMKETMETRRKEKEIGAIRKEGRNSELCWKDRVLLNHCI